MADTWVVGFGRFQPPTLGHDLMIKEIARIAAAHKEARATVFVSKSERTMRNPLSALYRLVLLNGLYFQRTGINFRYMSDSGILGSLNAFSHRAPRNLIVVAGEDRAEEYREKLFKYNGIEFPMFRNHTVVSVPRTTQKTNVSGTLLRDLARANEYDAFASFLPIGVEDVDIRYMYRKIRQMGFKIDDHQTTNQKT